MEHSIWLYLLSKYVTHLQSRVNSLKYNGESWLENLTENCGNAIHFQITLTQQDTQITTTVNLGSSSNRYDKQTESYVQLNVTEKINVYK